jgi:hypothetical protein
MVLRSFKTNISFSPSWPLAAPFFQLRIHLLDDRPQSSGILNAGPCVTWLRQDRLKDHTVK